MSWQEDCKKTSDFHFAKQKEFGESQTGRPRKGEKKSGWSIRDTANALKLSIRHVVEDLRLSAHRDYHGIQDLSRQDALYFLTNGKIRKLPTKEKLFQDYILSALACLKGSSRDRIRQATKILERALE